jgi:hypothetical protein
MGEGGGEVKNEISSKSLFELVKPPFKAVLSNGFIVDQSNRTVSRIPALFDIHLEGELTDELHHWIVKAMNEKWDREKVGEASKEEITNLITPFKEWYFTKAGQRDQEASKIYTECPWPDSDGLNVLVRAFIFRAFVAGYDLGKQEVVDEKGD